MQALQRENVSVGRSNTFLREIPEAMVCACASVCWTGTPGLGCVAPLAGVPPSHLGRVAAGG